MKNKLTPEQINDLRRLYVEEKLSTHQIAKMMGVDHRAIYNHLKRLGVEMRTVARKLTPEQIADLPRLYLDEKLSTIQIAKMMGVSHVAILFRLQRLGVETRKTIAKLTPEQISDLKRLYVDEKLSTYQIAKMMGVSHVAILFHLQRLGVETRTVETKNTRKLTPDQVNDLKRLYLDEKLSTIQIAKMMGVSPVAILFRLQRLGVETRKRKTIAKLTPEQISDLKRLYVDEHLSTVQIAKMMGLSQPAIYNHLKRLGVETRPVETKLTKAKINDLKRLYVDEKLSTIKIAKMMGVSQPNIYNHLKRLGVETRPVETKLTKAKINDLKRLYVDEKLSAIKIAEMMGVEHSTIYKHLKRLGVETRTLETKLTPDQVQEAIRLYTVHKLSTNRIAEMMDTTPEVIYRQLKRLGVEMRPITKKLTQEQINDLKRLYLDENLSINQIAKMMGVNVATIWQHLKRRGVETRPSR